jgi:hypothetical protein
MDPTLLALLGGGGGGGGGGGKGGGGGGALSAVGGAIDTGFDIYKDLEQLKLARAQTANQERMNKFSRLMQLLESGQGMQDRLSNQNRLFALRNPGV